MIRGLLAALALLLGACAPASTPQAAAPPPAAAASLDPVADRLVERVVDGDTVILAGGERVRVLGINAVEMKHPDAAVHAVAVQGQHELARAVQGRRASVIAGMPQEPRDRYGRLLAYLDLPDGTDVGESLIAAGLARAYPSAHPRAQRYRDAAFAARTRRQGLWRVEVATTLGLEPEPATCEQAASRVGRIVRIAGRLEAGDRGDRVQKLTLRDASGAFDVVVFPSRYDEIPPELVAAWTAAPVEVSGEVSLHRGRPQIVIEDPFQVESKGSR